MGSVSKMLAAIDEKAEYSPILEESHEKSSISDGGYADSVLVLPQRPSKARRLVKTSLKAFTIIFAIIGVLLLSYTFITRMVFLGKGRFVPSLNPSCSCGGTTVAEAKKRGCVLSPLAISWLPPHCIDQELSDQFDKAGPGPNGEWDYWGDQNMTRHLNHDEIGDLGEHNGVFYTTQEWHVIHCVYTWQKHYRSQWTGVTIERRSNGLDHIAHCAMIFRIRDDLQAIATVSGISLDADDPGDDGIHGAASKGDKFEVPY